MKVHELVGLKENYELVGFKEIMNVHELVGLKENYMSVLFKANHDLECEL